MNRSRKGAGSAKTTTPQPTSGQSSDTTNCLSGERINASAVPSSLPFFFYTAGCLYALSSTCRYQIELIRPVVKTDIAYELEVPQKS
jgi:hypothetical protein